MTYAAGVDGIARWSRDQPQTLLITDLIGNILDSHRVPAPGDRPGPETLWRTGWCAYPGTEWHEEPPGQWTRAVFHMPTTGGNSQGRIMDDLRAELEHAPEAQRQQAELTDLARQYPDHRLWTETLPGLRRLHYVAQRRTGTQARPYLVVTHDLAELRDALRPRSG
jgi:hypothetical protein